MEIRLSLGQLRAIDHRTFDLVSVDMFDTLLLRDYSTQRGRFQDVARHLAGELGRRGYSVDAATLLKLRCLVHDLAYRAVMMERPAGDATLAHMIDIQLAMLGLDQSLAGVFVEAELAVEAARLVPNNKLLGLLRSFRAAGKRLVVVSDMYFSRENLDALLRTLLHDHPIDRIYVSADIGLTKHSGRLLSRIAELEHVAPNRILHCGDHPHADVAMSRAAGCQAVLLRRPTWVHALRRLSALQFLLSHYRTVMA